VKRHWRKLLLISLIAILPWTPTIGRHAYRFMVNAEYGCFPWSPAVVQYHDSMTVCPGQTVIVGIPVPNRNWFPIPIPPHPNREASGI
jgi:hypothetical protein